MDINHSSRVAILYVSMDTEKLMNIADKAIENKTHILIVSAKSDVKIVSQIIGYDQNTKINKELTQRISKLEKAPIYIVSGITSEEEMHEGIRKMIKKYPIHTVYIDDMVLQINGITPESIKSFLLSGKIMVNLIRKFLLDEIRQGKCRRIEITATDNSLHLHDASQSDSCTYCIVNYGSFSVYRYAKGDDGVMNRFNSGREPNRKQLDYGRDVNFSPASSTPSVEDLKQMARELLPVPICC